MLHQRRNNIATTAEQDRSNWAWAHFDLGSFGPVLSLGPCARAVEGWGVVTCHVTKAGVLKGVAACRSTYAGVKGGGLANSEEEAT
jgi:hypothetical protein